MLPTYNEAENISPLIKELLNISEQMGVVIVDDDSPDGTWKIVARLGENNPRIHLVHRKTERGRGTAGLEGFKQALKLGADLIIEMDADFSHHPRFIPELLKASEQADVVIGSRLIKGGGERDRGFLRRFITRLANVYVRLVLRIPVKDCTSGFRVFHRRVLEAINLDKMTSTGPEVVQEVLLAAHNRGFGMKEVPISFEPRKSGRSTFNLPILIRSFYSILRFRWRGKKI